MSPYRVVVSKHDKRSNMVNEFIFAAMLSVDRNTKERRIFIIDKPLPMLATHEDKRRIAHKMTSALNSTILAKYIIKFNSDINRYKVHKCFPHSSDSAYVLYNAEFTQSACLISAMNDYCDRNGYQIIQTI